MTSRPSLPQGRPGFTLHLCVSLLLLLSFSMGLQATVLPEDRADLMYHRYDGGGVEVDGPSILVRKSFGGNISLNANYYVD
ncbi:MAG: hypothetical protein G8D61_20695, partial [gamma proteobacterium symbiont of Ctena orbiculata]